MPAERIGENNTLDVPAPPQGLPGAHFLGANLGGGCAMASVAATAAVAAAATADTTPHG